MDITLLHLALVVVGMLLVAGFVRQFSPRGALYALPVVGAVLGVFALRHRRRRKRLAQLAEREREIRALERRLSALQEEHAHSRREVAEARENLNEERRLYLLRLIGSERQARADVAAEAERIGALSPSELLDEISAYLDAAEAPAPAVRAVPQLR